MVSMFLAVRRHCWIFVFDLQFSGFSVPDKFEINPKADSGYTICRLHCYGYEIQQRLSYN